MGRRGHGHAGPARRRSASRWRRWSSRGCSSWRDAGRPDVGRGRRASAGCATQGHDLVVGAVANIVVVDPSASRTITPTALASKSRNTPYAGMELPGRVVHTLFAGTPDRARRVPRMTPWAVVASLPAADFVEQAQVTNWPARIGLVAVMLALIALAAVGHAARLAPPAAASGRCPGRRRRRRRPMPCSRIRSRACSSGTGTNGDWMDRIVVHDLGVRSRATIAWGPDGIWLDRSGARSVFIPAAAVVGRADRPRCRGHGAGEGQHGRRDLAPGRPVARHRLPGGCGGRPRHCVGWAHDDLRDGQCRR